MAARAGVTSARPRPPPPPSPALPARQPRPGRSLTLGLGWQIPHRASRGGRRQRWSRGSRGGPGSRGTPGGPRPPLAQAALGRSGRKVLDNRFFLARAPPGFAARVWARGFPGGGLEALRPLALFGASKAPKPLPSAPPTCVRLVRARAAEPSWGGSAVQGTPGLPRPGRDRRGGAATYPLLRVSGGSRSPPKVFASPKKLLRNRWKSDLPPIQPPTF